MRKKKKKALLKIIKLSLTRNGKCNKNEASKNQVIRKHNLTNKNKMRILKTPEKEKKKKTPLHGRTTCTICPIETGIKQFQ